MSDPDLIKLGLALLRARGVEPESYNEEFFSSRVEGTDLVGAVLRTARRLHKNKVNTFSGQRMRYGLK